MNLKIYLLFLLVVMLTNGCQSIEESEEYKKLQIINNEMQEEINQLENALNEVNESFIKLQNDTDQEKALLKNSITELEEQMAEVETRQRNNDRYKILVSDIEQHINDHNLNYFLPSKHEVGDFIQGMRIKSIEAQKELWYKVQFEGEIELTGDFYITDSDDEYWGRELFFFRPNKESLDKLPCIFGRQSGAFVLDIQDRDVEEVKAKEGHVVSVTIDSYCVDNLPHNVYNTAVLVNIID